MLWDCDDARCLQVPGERQNASGLIFMIFQVGYVDHASEMSQNWFPGRVNYFCGRTLAALIVLMFEGTHFRPCEHLAIRDPHKSK